MNKIYHEDIQFLVVVAQSFGLGCETEGSRFKPQC